MEGYVRRVVTGHDENGRAVVVSDGPAPKVHSSPLRPGHVTVDIWRTNEMPARIARRADEPTSGPRKIVANPNGTIVRIASIPPEGEWMREMDTERAKQVFTALGNPEASTFAENQRHPFMHRTETIDYAIILEGEMYCVLDDDEVLLKAGDVLVQCGTNHAWSNRSGQPCKVAFILIDGKFDPELAAQLGPHR